MKEITSQQQRVLDCIQIYLNKTGFPPTRADICRELGFTLSEKAYAYGSTVAVPVAKDIIESLIVIEKIPPQIEKDRLIVKKRK